jgi:recombination protein RecA
MKPAKTKKTTADMAQPGNSEEKQKALDTAITQITKQYGQGSIMKLGENTSMNVTSIPTGSLSLDIAL